MALFSSQPEMDSSIATKLVGPEVIDISQMEDEMATDVLRASLIRKYHYQITTQLLHQLGCLPLAIIQAVTLMKLECPSPLTCHSSKDRKM